MKNLMFMFALAGALLLAGHALASEPPSDPLTVVAIGEVTARAGSGVDRADTFPMVYGAMLAADLGVEVEVVNRASSMMRTLAHWGSDIRSDGRLRTELARADVVIVWICFTDLTEFFHHYAPHQWPDPMRDRLVAGLFVQFGAPERFAPDVAAPLRAAVPEHATILIGDCFMPPTVIELHAAEPYWPELEQLLYGQWRDGLVGAAAEIDAVVVPTYAAISGPAGDAVVDPAFVARQDHLFRFNEAGHRFLADLFRRHDGLGGHGD